MMRYIPLEFRKVFIPDIRDYVQVLLKNPKNNHYPEKTVYYKDAGGWIRFQRLGHLGFVIPASKMNGNRCGTTTINTNIDPLIPLIDRLWRTEETAEAKKILEQIKKMGKRAGSAYQILMHISNNHTVRQIEVLIKGILEQIKPDAKTYAMMEEKRVDALRIWPISKPASKPTTQPTTRSQHQ